MNTLDFYYFQKIQIQINIQNQINIQQSIYISVYYSDKIFQSIHSYEEIMDWQESPNSNFYPMECSKRKSNRKIENPYDIYKLRKSNQFESSFSYKKIVKRLQKRMRINRLQNRIKNKKRIVRFQESINAK
jgi:hypothetical protein